VTRVKICGITTPEDARLVVSAGADAIGLIFFSGSTRCIDVSRAAEILAAIPPFVTPVALFVNASLEVIRSVTDALGIRTVQLQGDEPPELPEQLRPLRIIKAFRVGTQGDLERLDGYRPDAFLLDAYVPGKPGGTGVTFDWFLAVPVAARRRVILAGGLNPENVAEAVRIVRPYAVDVCSGVEYAPGRKDPDKVHAFVARAKSAR